MKGKKIYDIIVYKSDNYECIQTIKNAIFLDLLN